MSNLLRSDRKLAKVLRMLFRLTGAQSVEIHSGDREPGYFIRREDVIKGE